MRVVHEEQPDPVRAKVGKAIVSVFRDPFYYAMATPSVVVLILAAALCVGTVAAIMVGVWMIVKVAALGSWPSLEGQPVKMFIGAACMALLPLCAGIIHRRMTAPEIRGKFVCFSKCVKLRQKDHVLVFSLIDQRKTQLIGTDICIEMVSLDAISNTLTARTVQLGSPGIIAIPTEIRIPLASVFPSLDAGSRRTCEGCGASGFKSAKRYANHLSYHHNRALPDEGDLMKRLREEVGKLELFRVRLVGVDEVSGKGGVAIKHYLPADFVDGEHSVGGSDETFSVISRSDSKSESDWSDSDGKSTAGSQATNTKYVHIDFKYS